MAAQYHYATNNGRLCFGLDPTTDQPLTDKVPFANSKRVTSCRMSSDNWVAGKQVFMHECECGERTADFTDLMVHRNVHHSDDNNQLTFYWSATYNSELEAMGFVKNIFGEQEKKFNRVPNTGIIPGKEKGSTAWQCDRSSARCYAFVVLQKMPGDKFGVFYSRSHSVNCAPPNGPTSSVIGIVSKSTVEPSDGPPPSKKARNGGNVQSSSELSQQPPGQSTSRGQGSLHAFKCDDYDCYGSRLSATKSLSAVSFKIEYVPITTPPADLPTVGTVGYFRLKADGFQSEFDDLVIRRSEAVAKRDSLQREIDNLDKGSVSVSEENVKKTVIKKKKTVSFEKTAGELKTMDEENQRLTICLDALKANLARVTTLIADTKKMMDEVKEQRDQMRKQEDLMKDNL